MTDERMSLAEVEVVLARLDNEVSDLQERVMGHQPLTNAKDLVDAAHKRLNETQVRVADLEEWKARTEGGLLPIEPGATFEPTGPVFTLTDDGRMVHDAPADHGDATPGAALYADYRHLAGRHGFQSPPWDKTGDWEREWWEGLAGQHCNDSELNEHLSRSYDRNREQRKLIERQRDMIDRLMAGPTDKALAAARKDRDDAVRKLADANAEHERQIAVVCGQRNEAQNNVRIGQARIGELERERDAAMDRTSLIEKERNAAWKERDKAHARIAELDAKVRKQQGDMRRIGEIADQPPF